MNALRNLTNSRSRSRSWYCSRKALELMIKPGEFYVGDRYYVRDYQFLNRLSEAVCSYLIRLREDSVMEVVEELPLVPADVKAGVGIQLYSAMIVAFLLSRRLENFQVKGSMKLCSFIRPAGSARLNWRRSSRETL